MPIICVKLAIFCDTNTNNNSWICKLVAAVAPLFVYWICFNIWKPFFFTGESSLTYRIPICWCLPSHLKWFDNDWLTYLIKNGLSLFVHVKRPSNWLVKPLFLIGETTIKSVVLLFRDGDEIAGVVVAESGGLQTSAALASAIMQDRTPLGAVGGGRTGWCLFYKSFWGPRCTVSFLEFGGFLFLGSMDSTGMFF